MLLADRDGEDQDVAIALGQCIEQAIEWRIDDFDLDVDQLILLVL